MRLVSIILYQISRILGAVSRSFLSLSRHGGVEHFHNTSVLRSTRYDMDAEANEAYYLQQYWEIALPHLKTLANCIDVLDLGCGQGRFSLKLAKLFGESSIKACDISKKAIDKAIFTAKQDGLENISYHHCDINEFILSEKTKSSDLIVCTEVFFFLPNWEKTLKEISRVLRPGGILLLSFRPTYYNLLFCIKHNFWDDIDKIIYKRSGMIMGSNTTYTWQTSVEINNFIVNELNMELLEIFGVGSCSGIFRDPNYEISSPDKLSEHERSYLMKAEIFAGKNNPDSGRYLLAIARKPGMI
jgi:ubiquinone/menaquinone biosynthesis C-methylase UbiE